MTATLYSATCPIRGMHPSLTEEVFDARQAKCNSLKRDFARMVAGDSDPLSVDRCSKLDEVTLQFLELAAPVLAPVAEEAARQLQAVYGARKPGQCPEELVFRIACAKDPSAAFAQVRKSIIGAASVEGSNDTGWMSFIAFKYLSDIAVAHRTLLSDICIEKNTSVVELKVYVGLFDLLPANVGMRFETQRLRAFLSEAQLATRGIEKFPGRRSVSPISFFNRVYAHLRDAGVLYLAELRKYDEPLVKALYKECLSRGTDIEAVLPTKRSDLSRFNCEGVSEGARKTVLAARHRTWRLARRQADARST